MSIDFVFRKLEKFIDRPALAADQRVFSYYELLDNIKHWQNWLNDQKISEGSVVSLCGDYSVDVVALLLALGERRCIIVPLSPVASAQHNEFREIASSRYDIFLDRNHIKLEVTDRQSEHPIYSTLRKRATAGLVLFSSGSTGKSKAVVHDLSRLLSRYKVPGKSLRIIVFLQFDHIGGINTLFYALTNGGMAIVPHSRRPEEVCLSIEQHQAQVLPVSPTFLNLLILSEAYKEFDLSSLKLITYGTEPMPQSTLKIVAERFPGVKLQQTYGLSELGILQSQSRVSGSLWLKVGGNGFKTKIVDDRLWIKADSAMLGYLNDESIFDDDGYFDTGDIVEQDGEWIRILGRDSDIINVGGEKVCPAEVESVLLEMNNVQDAVVFGQENAITGMIVAARIQLQCPEIAKDFKIRMRKYCRARLTAYKVPSKVILSEESLHNPRFKRMRTSRS